MGGGGGGGGGGAPDLSSLEMAIDMNMMSISANSDGISSAMNSFGLLTF